MLDLKQLAEQVSGTIKAWVADRLKTLEAGLPDLVRKQIEALPKPLNGKDYDPQVMSAEISRQVALLPKPADGKSIDAAEVRAMVSAEVGAQVAKLPPAAPGKDADPAAIERAAKAAAAALPPPDVAPLVRAEVQRQVAEIPRPEPGKDGKDYDPTVLKAAVALEVRAAVDALPPAAPGKDADIEAVKAIAVSAAREAVAAIKVPRDGKDADQPAIVSQVFDLVMRAIPKPQDGKSVTVDDVKPLLEAEVQHWEHEFERRCQDVLQRVAERHKGKDGVDGFQLDDLSLSLKDGRTVVLTLRSGDRVVERTVELEGMPIYRGTFVSGKAYRKGDAVTYGGSTWIAKADTTEAPAQAHDAWQMSVKGTR